MVAEASKTKANKLFALFSLFVFVFWRLNFVLFLEQQLPGVPVMSAMPTMQQGELDNALRGLKEGNAFRRKRENRRSMLVTDSDETAEAVISLQKMKVPPPVMPKKFN